MPDVLSTVVSVLVVIIVGNWNFTYLMNVNSVKVITVTILPDHADSILITITITPNHTTTSTTDLGLATVKVCSNPIIKGAAGNGHWFG